MASCNLSTRTSVAPARGRYLSGMSMRHQKGSLSAKGEAKRGRGANKLAGLPERDVNSRELLASEIQAIVKRLGLTRPKAAAVAKIPPTRMALLLDGKLFSFNERHLLAIRDRLRGEGGEADKTP